jgi:sulfonate transport system substrate-binding protein
MVLGGAGLAALTIGSGPVRAAPVAVRYATGGGIGSSEIETVIFNAAMPRAALPRMGQDYSLDMTFTAGTPQAAALLAAGQADMATLSCSALAAGLLKGAFPSGLTIVGDNYQDGHAGFASNGFFVLDESPLKTVADLRGKIVAVNAFGSAVDLILRVVLKRQGIDPRRDLQVVEIGLPNIGTALRQKRIDCGCLVLPFQAVEAQAGGVRTLFNAADALGPSSVVFNVVSNDFLKAHPETVRAVLSDYVGALKYLTTPANHAEAVSVTAGLTKLAPSTLSYIMGEKDYYRAPDGRLDAGLIQKPIDALHELGLLPGKVDVAKFVDMGYLPT